MAVGRLYVDGNFDSQSKQDVNFNSRLLKIKKIFFIILNNAYISL